MPLETFTAALDLLAVECDRLAIIGLSYGAEAALLTAIRDPRLVSVIAIAPTDVVWEGAIQHDDDPARSKWTWHGEPVPFVPLDRTWESESEPPSFTPFYEQSRSVATEEVVAAATIPVEQFHGELVLIAGGDDQVWNSAAHAGAIAARREGHGLSTTVIEDPDAGHPVVLPGENPANPARAYLVGGDAGAPERLGALAWPSIQRALGLPYLRSVPADPS
ncbi:MAG: acyl-CoA thioester hydrolase/BAAT C-terminal domain-containing protein [Microbacterium sp.]